MGKKPTDKPAYVQNFTKPASTEIKHISGHWYLYERRNVYDPAIKRSRKNRENALGVLQKAVLFPANLEESMVSMTL